tara:strand:+ start:1040 stop:1303 length:264 start_codon:yes stop_codon:yes gene_type:complete
MNKNLYKLDRNGIKDYIFRLQSEVQKNILTNNSIDDFLDNTNIFDEFEELLPDQEYGVLILTVLNNFKSEVILNDLLDIIENAIKKD